jgi:hypothetical protein
MHFRRLGATPIRLPGSVFGSAGQLSFEPTCFTLRAAVAISLDNPIATASMIDPSSGITNAFPGARRLGCGMDGFPVPRSVSVEIVVWPLSPLA